MMAEIKLAGRFRIPIFIMYIAYLFYDKQQILSIVLFVVGVGLSIYIIFNEIEFKKKRHDAPWLFGAYRGE